jgi:hypothetical protein
MKSASGLEKLLNGLAVVVLCFFVYEKVVKPFITPRTVGSEKPAKSPQKLKTASMQEIRELKQATVEQFKVWEKQVKDKYPDVAKELSEDIELLNDNFAATITDTNNAKVVVMEKDKCPKQPCFSFIIRETRGKARKGAGGWMSESGALAIDPTLLRGNVYNAATVFHELVHAKQTLRGEIHEKPDLNSKAEFPWEDEAHEHAAQLFNAISDGKYRREIQKVADQIKDYSGKQVAVLPMPKFFFGLIVLNNRIDTVSLGALFVQFLLDLNKELIIRSIPALEQDQQFRTLYARVVLLAESQYIKDLLMMQIAQLQKKK